MAHEKLRNLYPPGTRIRLVQMGPDPRPVPPGTEGTVKHVDGLGQIIVAWDNGSSLSLIPSEDAFEVIGRSSDG